MIVEEPETETSNRVPAAVSKIETRFSIAKDALENEKSHALESANQFLQALNSTLESFRIDHADSTTLDERVLQVLQQMKPCRDFFLQIVQLATNAVDSQKYHELFRDFLGQAVAFKQAPRDIVHFNHLWCDHYRFFLRELFIGTIAVLVRAQQFEEASRYMKTEYRWRANRDSRGSFIVFDAYIKSLDEFRARRLRANRLSIAADVLKERADLGFISFDDMMQADFLLCVRGLLHYPAALTRWFPRTLVFAEEYERTGFDVFFKAQSGSHVSAVCTLLGVRDKADLVSRFEQVSEECGLAQWKFGGVPIPFASYMGLSALATT